MGKVRRRRTKYNKRNMNNNRHIPSGYKPSPLGIIPEDWEVKRIGDFGKVITGNTPPTEDTDNYGNAYKFVSPADISDSKYIEATEKHLSEKGFSISRQMPIGTVLFTCIGSTIGKCAIANETLTSNQQINAIICDTKHSGEYLYYELSHRSNKIKQIAGEQAVPIINKSTFENYKVLCPPFEEQKGIAKILSLWDTAIAKQTALIEQLTLRKRGLMQQLLTGKKRLKGFGGEWEKIKFKEIFQRKTQIVNDSSNVQVLSVTKEGIVSQKEYFNKEVASDDTSKYLLVEKGDLAMSGLNFWMGSCHILTQYEKGIISPAYKVFSIRDGFSIEYIVNFVQSYNFKSSLLGSSVIGASIVRRNLDLEMLEEWTYLLPSLPEQKAISDILTYADKEIETQKQKLAAMQTQKKGLMQVLLTGKRRINK